MKKSFFIIQLFCMLSLTMVAQPPIKKGDSIRVKRRYEVFATSETDSASLVKRNEFFSKRGGERSVTLAALGSALAASYSNKLIQETMNVTSRVFEFAGKVVKGLILKDINDREAWLKKAESQNHFKLSLSDATQIDNFYYTPSTNGAFDPMDMKFNGFGCMGYMRPEQNDSTKKDELPKSPRWQESDADTAEIWEFYLMCRLRDDSIGIDHMNNHSRFYMEIDQFMFDTRHTSLPNDSIDGRMQTRFDFKKRKDLTFSVNVKLFSSWVNEAAMMVDNQQLGEFDFIAKIDPKDVDENGIFVYDPEKHQKNVGITGDCFVVPRSFTGTSTNPSWGTGQYRIEMTLKEDCAMNLEWYRDSTKIRREVKKDSFRWDKKKWKPEWKEMQAHGKKRSIVRDAWISTFKTAYVQRDWVHELIAPLTVTICDAEKEYLGDLLKVTPTATSTPAGSTTQTPPADNGGKPAK